MEENDVPTPPDSRAQHAAWEWTEDEVEEWEKWQREKAVQGLWEKDLGEFDGGEDSGVWEEDAQPPSEHVQAAAAACSVALPPAQALPRASCDAPAKMNSTTHRAEYMKLVS